MKDPTPRDPRIVKRGYMNEDEDLYLELSLPRGVLFD